MGLAQEVARKIPADSIFCDAIHRYLNLFSYGAVAPDTCFHYILGPGRAAVNSAGQIFHTTDASSLVPVLEFLNRFPHKDADALAFAAGLCCHIMTDTVFHPMVYYFSGAKGIHGNADTRHRMFETALDLHFRSLMHTRRRLIPFHRMSKHLEISDKRLSCLLKHIFCKDNPEYQKYLLYAFRSHCLANALFTNHHLYQLTHMVSAFNFLTEYEVLFYPFKQPVRFRFFDGILKFKHPVSGEEYGQTLESLSNKAVKNTLLLLSVIEAAILGGKNLDDVIFDPHLPEISPCLPEDCRSFMHWHGDMDIRRKLYSEYSEITV